MKIRVVEAETLDHLPKHNPAAIRSRQDLRRVNRIMRSTSIIERALRPLKMRHGALENVRILEIGAGDGHLMLDVARTLRGCWRNVELTLLDRVDLVERSTIERYSALGWQVNSEITDVLMWATNGSTLRVPGGSNHWNVIIANLFLHHFEGAQLASILTAIEARTDCFFACEPRRAWAANVGSHLIGAVGANSVTRRDAVLSVRAGFRDREISALWPGKKDLWAAKEYSAGLFSHCFYAERLPAIRQSTADATRV